MTVLSRVKTLVARSLTVPRISVFGDSHSVALLRAQQYGKRTHQYENIRVNRLRKEKDGKSIGDTSLAEFCREIGLFGPEDFVFSAVGGNQYAIVSTVRPPVDYDILCSPTDQVAGENLQLVPFRALHGFIESGVQETVGPVLRTLRKSTKAQVYHLIPPPPKEDNDFIVAHAEGYFADEGLRNFGATRPELRLKCWKVQLRSLTALCQELDIITVMPPAKALTSGGFLAPEFYANDVTHANRRYGEAVFKQILDLAGTQRGQE
jgi:hypothetical protein